MVVIWILTNARQQKSHAATKGWMLALKYILKQILRSTGRKLTYKPLSLSLRDKYESPKVR